jgi:hypothetical protein
MASLRVGATAATARISACRTPSCSMARQAPARPTSSRPSPNRCCAKTCRPMAMPAAPARPAAGSPSRTTPITAACAPRRFEDEAPEGEEGADGDGKKAKSTKAPSKEIKIEQIRALADFMNISTHRQGLRVVVLYPAEALNTPASNALLKTLEEPPPGTVFLLSSNSLDRLLPTILSRCRKFALPMPDEAQALAWLKEQGLAGRRQLAARAGRGAAGRAGPVRGGRTRGSGSPAAAAGPTRASRARSKLPTN